MDQEDTIYIYSHIYIYWFQLFMLQDFINCNISIHLFLKHCHWKQMQLWWCWLILCLRF